MRDFNIRTLTISTDDNLEIIKKINYSSIKIDNKIIIKYKLLKENISKDLLALSRCTPKIDLKVLLFN